MKQVWVIEQEFPYEGGEVCCVVATAELADKMVKDYNDRDKDASLDGKYWKFVAVQRPLYET